MNPSPYTEDTLVQQTTADYLQQQLGWESVYAYNSEDFGRSLLGRGSDREVVLTRTMRGKLVELNMTCPMKLMTAQCAGVMTQPCSHSHMSVASMIL